MRWRSAKGNHVPVDLLAALAVHGIEAEVLRVGDGREEARLHGFGSALEGCLDFGVPLGGVLLEALGGGGFVGLAGGLVEAEFDDRDVGVNGSEEVVEGGLREVEFDLVELLRASRGSGRG